MNEESMTSYPNPDLLFQWMIEKLSGTISAPDEQTLNLLIETNPEIRKAWVNVQDKFSTEDKKNKLARFDEDEYWTVVQHANPLPWRGAKVISIRRYISVAAIVLGILIGGYLVFVQNRKDEVLYSGDSKRNTKQPDAVQLQLAGGEIIDLSTTTGKVKAGNVTLKHTPKSLSYGENGTEAGTMSSLNTLRVPIGLDYKVVLSDGTEVWLNSATELRFPFSFSRSTREISLNGEAYLNVAVDPKKPFIVHSSGNSSIQVLGTSFNINTYDSLTVRVALVEGSVKLSTAGRQTFIRPGQEAAYQHNSGNIEVKPFNKEAVLSWREGILYFDNATLEEICRVVPRWFGQEIVMDNATVAQKRFTGVLDRRKPIPEFIHALQTTAALEYYIDKNGVIHLK